MIVSQEIDYRRKVCVYMCEYESKITAQCGPSPNLHQHLLESPFLTAGQLDGFIWWHHCENVHCYHSTSVREKMDHLKGK